MGVFYRRDKVLDIFGMIEFLFLMDEMKRLTIVYIEVFLEKIIGFHKYD